MTALDDVARRLQRLEDIHEIEQLAVRYAMAVDDRDIDAWLELFAPDVIVGKGRRGREALREFIVPNLQQFYRSIHLISGHRVDLHTSDQATGAVYCRAEHEVGGRWIVIAIRYDDEYSKVDGRWYFTRRKDKHWYETDLPDRPQDAGFHDWASAPARPCLPEPTASWTSFWDGVDITELSAAPVQPTD